MGIVAGIVMVVILVLALILLWAAIGGLLWPAILTDRRRAALPAPPPATPPECVRCARYGTEWASLNFGEKMVLFGYYWARLAWCAATGCPFPMPFP